MQIIFSVGIYGILFKFRRLYGRFKICLHHGSPALGYCQYHTGGPALGYTECCLLGRHLVKQYFRFIHYSTPLSKRAHFDEEFHRQFRAVRTAPNSEKLYNWNWGSRPMILHLWWTMCFNRALLNLKKIRDSGIIIEKNRILYLYVMFSTLLV